MTPATEKVLRSLADHLKADSETGAVIIGGFDQTPLGKEGVQRLVQDGLLCVIGIEPVDYVEPTEGQPESTRWQEQITITVLTVRILPESPDFWGLRFKDCAWLVSLVADFCDRLEDGSSAECEALGNTGVGIAGATLTQADYAPGAGEDLDAGFISVGATLSIQAEVAKTGG